MSTLKWNYLGCMAEKGEGNPVVSGTPVAGTKNQATCLQAARDKKFFALQTNRGDNCYVGNEMEGIAVEDKYCASTCSPYDELAVIDGRAGCGDVNSRPDGFFSVYELNQSMTPMSTLVDRNNLLIENSAIGEKFKNGLYKFSDSSHAWQWDAKRAFDSNPVTFWHSPYGFGSEYSMDRSKNYTKDGYVAQDPMKSTGVLGSAQYNMEQKPFDPKRVKDHTHPYITHGTQEIQLTNANPKVHYGEWIQIELPFQIQLTGYELSPAKLNPRNALFEMQRFPKFYIVLGSNDGTNWMPLHTETSHVSTADLIAKMGTKVDDVTSSTGLSMVDQTKWDHKVTSEYPFKIFRLVIKETNGHRAAALGEFKLYGKICVDLNGQCKTFDTSAIEALKANAIAMGVSSIQPGSFQGEFENFTNMNSVSQDPDEIIQETFMNNIEIKDPKNVFHEMDVFKTSYSKY